jgi:arylsulfatase
VSNFTKKSVCSFTDPAAFDLITDSKEEYPATGLRNSWNAGPAMKIVTQFEQSLKKYPPIPPGTPDPTRPRNPGHH